MIPFRDMQYSAKYRTPSSKLISNRGATLLILAIPLATAIFAFGVAVATTASGEMAQGTTRFYLAAFAYSYLLACLTCLPSYAISYAWYWWSSKDSDSDIKKRLWLMPLVSTAFVWFPLVVLPDLNGVERFQTLLLLAFASLVFGYLWIALVRLILRLWRKL